MSDKILLSFVQTEVSYPCCILAFSLTVENGCVSAQSSTSCVRGNTAQRSEINWRISVNNPSLKAGFQRRLANNRLNQITLLIGSSVRILYQEKMGIDTLYWIGMSSLWILVCIAVVLVVHRITYDKYVAHSPQKGE